MEKKDDDTDTLYLFDISADKKLKSESFTDHIDRVGNAFTK